MPQPNPLTELAQAGKAISDLMVRLAENQRPTAEEWKQIADAAARLAAAAAEFSRRASD